MAKYYYHGKNVGEIRKRKKILGCIFLCLGLLSLLYFFFPLISYRIFLSPAFASDIQTPIPKRMVLREGGVMGLLSQGISSITTDYNDARNWYPQIHQSEDSSNKQVENYTLSIPKLSITNAAVSRVDYDLSKNLVHYYGPTNPTQNGTSVIYGHSTLPQWFDPTNYKTIFATLHTLQVGDTMTITVDNKTFFYKIYSMTITTPDDVDIFSQTYDNSYITLVTCTPPGTIWKRLIVRAARIGLE